MGLYSRLYTINGVERRVVSDPEETLATVLRRIGLTGVKVGCGTGQCGSCTVLLDGEPVRSCVVRMKRVKEYSKIETIEGLGTAANLHPLQKAWIKYGGVQCGYCTPGFIVSAKGLLAQNPKPTRQEVRDWFTKNKNLCRCTGYKPLVDAVMAAAEVMRGDAPLSALDYEEPADGKIYNSRHPRPAALGKVLGVTDYGADLGLKMPKGTLEVAVVWANRRHANILGIDFSEAEKMEGVVAVLTAKDIKGTNDVGGAFEFPRGEVKSHNMPILCETKVRRPGDPVALVVADTEAHARAAAKVVNVDYEDLPICETFLDSCLPDAVQVDEHSPNLLMYQPMFVGEDTREIFDTAEEKGLVVTEGSFHHVPQPHLPIESASAQAFYDEDGLLTIAYKSQFTHSAVASIAPAIGLPVEKVRCVMSPCGGSFGYSMLHDVPAMVAAAAVAVNQPVNLNLTYAEFQRNSGKRPGGFANSRMAVDKDGKIVALEVDLASDGGSWGFQSPYETQFTALYAGGMHLKVPNVRVIARSGLSNQCYGTTYRSFGSPQGFTYHDALLNMAANKLGIDQFDIRYNNLAREGDMSPGQLPYPNYRMPGLMDKMRPAWEEAKKWRDEPATPGWKRGIGITLGGFNSGSGRDYAECRLVLNPDNSVTIYISWQDIGQGSDIGALANAEKCLAELNLPKGMVRLDMSDTKKSPQFGPSAGSRGHLMCAHCLQDGANKLIAAMRKEDGSFRTYDEMIAEGIAVEYIGAGSAEPFAQDFDPDTGMGQPCPDYSHCVFITGIEVEEATGKVKIIFSRNGADCGVVGNYLAVEGQVWGGLEHSYGYALSEIYGDDQKKYETMRGCGFPECNDIPDDMTVIFQEDPRLNTSPFGSIGCSEGFQSSPHCAVVNAIEDAVGVRIFDFPATPEKVKEGMERLAKGEDLTPDKYYLGKDFYEMIDEVYENPMGRMKQ